MLPAGPPMTLGNMRELGVRPLIAHCLNPSCRHEGLIDVSKFPDDTEVLLGHVDVRPNWKLQAPKA
jgi:hypothetical protein